MKVKRYLVIHIGRRWVKVDLFEIVSQAMQLSKSEVKRLDKQKGLELYIEE